MVVQDWNWKTWVNVALATFALAALAVIAMGGMWLWIWVPIIPVALLAFTLPVARWGPAGLLLTFGVLVLLTGSGLWIGGDVGTTIAEVADQDNDGDGRIDEDPPGDWDNSANDVSQVDNAAELQNPDDDDGDGRIDEDPFAPPGTTAITRGLSRAGQLLTLGGTVMVIAFAVILHRRGRQPPTGPAGPQSPR